MKLITAAMLAEAGACKVQVAQFRALAPKGLAPNLKNLRLCEKAGLDVFWVKRLLSAPARAEYDKVCNTARAECDKVCSTAWAECDKVCAAASAEYDKVCAAASAEYDKVCAAASAEYDKVCSTARAECDKVCAAALIKALKAS